MENKEPNAPGSSEPQETYVRPMWQRVAAVILIILIVIATGIFAVWTKI